MNTTSRTLPAEHTKKNEIWKCGVAPSDAEETGLGRSRPEQAPVDTGIYPAGKTICQDVVSRSGDR